MATDECSLFQVELTDEQIQEWIPLECTSKDPQNCGPTALALARVVPRGKAQEFSRQVEEPGIDLSDLTKIMLNYMKRLDIKLSEARPINEIAALIHQKLFRGNITIIAISGASVDGVHPRHITTLARTQTGSIILFDGQYQKYYSTDEQLNEYFSKYTEFYYWCEDIKKKRKIHDIHSVLRKRKSESPKTKRRRMETGGKIRKKNKSRRRSGGARLKPI